MDYWWSFKKDYGQEPLSNLDGGKAEALSRVADLGYLVPQFGVVTSQAFTYYLQNQKLPADLLRNMQKDIASWSADRFAVRSSIGDKAAKETTVAEVMDTFLYVTAEELPNKIIACFRSRYQSESAQPTTMRKSTFAPHAAVIVQGMITAEAGGVAFSRAPELDCGLTMIEASHGVKQVGSEHGKLDKYLLTRQHQIVESTQQDPEEATHHSDANKDNSPKVTMVKNTPKQAVLSSEQIFQVNALVLNLEKELGFPVTIEWCFAEGSLYLLQVSPDTRPAESLSSYSDAQVADHYPGLTSPLTASFAAQKYHEIYTSALRLMGYPERERQALDQPLNRLVSYQYGHLYINLENYMRLAMSLPGQKNVLGHWQQTNSAQNQSHPKPNYTWHHRAWFYKLRTAMTMRWRVIDHKRALKSYYRHMDDLERRWGHAMGQKRDARQTGEVLMNLLRFKTRWSGFLVLNEQLFDLSWRKLTTKNQTPESLVANLLPQVLDGCHLQTPVLKSVDQLKDLESRLKATPKLQEFLTEWLSRTREIPHCVNWDLLARELIMNGFKVFVVEMKAWLDLYGDQCYESHKLESQPFTERPQDLVEILVWRAQQQLHLKSDCSDDHPITVGKLEILTAKPSRFWLHTARRAAKAHQEIRAMHNRYYSMVRTTLKSLSDHLGLPARQIFGLDIASISSWVSGHINEKALHDQCEAAAFWEKIDTSWPRFYYSTAKPSYDFKGTQPYFVNRRPLNPPGENRPSSIIGSGASPGNVEGKALVLQTPREILKVRDARDTIVITRSTDPTWAFVMDLCKGFVTEKSSYLCAPSVFGQTLGLPTVVGADDVTQTVKSGQRIRLNGSTGEITILS